MRRANKFLKLFVTLDEDFLVCDGARNLERKDESGGRLERPIAGGFNVGKQLWEGEARAQ